MKSTRLLGLFALVGLALLVTACGGGQQGSGGGGGGSESQQQVAEGGEAGTTEVCDVEPPDLNLQDAVVGFSQSEEEANPFRIAETQSIRDEASERGVGELIVTNAQSQASKQISDIQDMLAQGAQILIVAPLNAEGLEPAFEAANGQGVPVFLIDREITAAPCENYITFMGSNFLEQGQRAADALAEAAGEEGQVAILEGTPGASVTLDRTDGFNQRLDEAYPNMEVVASQTGNFVRTEGQSVMEQLLQSNPDINAVYAENDEMALGAIQAMRDRGLQPGQGVKIVSVDGTRQAVQAVVDGQINAVVETNPRFGPLAFGTIEQFLAGEPIPQQIIVQDRLYTPENAADELESTY